MTATIFPIALCLLIQSTVLLTLGLIAMRMARRRGPAVQSLVGRATLAGLGLALLLAGPLTGRVRGVWHVALAGPTPRHVAAPPETGGGRVKTVIKSRPFDGAELDRTALPTAPLAETLSAAHPALPTVPTPPLPFREGRRRVAGWVPSGHRGRPFCSSGFSPASGTFPASGVRPAASRSAPPPTRSPP